jgi:integrase/recombinase XerD
VDDGALKILHAWIEQRARHLAKVRLAPRELFITRNGKPVPAANLRRKIKQIARKVGITKRVHLHGFRHTHAAELAREGVQVNVIRRQLGHSSLAVTSKYLDHLHPSEVIDTIRARKWSA